MTASTQSLYRLLADKVSTQADKLAVVDGERAWTYGATGQEVERLTQMLLESGVEPGDRVVVHLRKGMAEVAAIFAVAKLGAVVVNVNAQWTLDQLVYVVNDCRACALVLDDAVALRLSKQSLPPSVKRVIVAGSASPAHSAFTPWSLLGAEEPTLISPEQAVDDTDLAMILYTSGSTGKPKGVMLSHRNLVLGAQSVVEYLKLTREDRLLSVLPYSFDYGLNQLTTMMWVGGTVVHQPVPMPAEIVQAVKRHGVTGLAAVPPLWSQLVRMLASKPEALPSLRYITNSGGKISRNILELMPSAFPGVHIFLMYGLTEAFRSTYLAPEKFASKMGSIGQAIPRAGVYVIKHGVGLAAVGETGELVHAGPLVSMGYWERPEVTAQKFRPCPELKHVVGDDCVVYSGDLVTRDADGDLWFVGRDDAMIKTSGFRLSPDEVEDKLHQSGLVAEAVAFGVPHDDLGEVVHAAVGLLEGCDATQLLQFCRREMPHYMIPRKFHLWSQAMPRTASGKLDRPTVVGLAREGIQQPQ